jgi:uncharacterized protein YjbI with pentapeptide repeats
LACHQKKDKSFLRAADLRGLVIENRDLENIDLGGEDTYLEGAVFKDSNLRGAILTKTSLKGVNFQGSDLTGANLSGSTLSGVSFKGTDLSGADLRHTDIALADFSAVRSIKGAVLTQGQESFLAQKYGLFTDEEKKRAWQEKDAEIRRLEKQERKRQKEDPNYGSDPYDTY